MGLPSHCFFKLFKIPFWKKPTTADHYKDQNPIWGYTILDFVIIGYRSLIRISKSIFSGLRYHCILKISQTPPKISLTYTDIVLPGWQGPLYEISLRYPKTS
jgi:hypothetical protein